MKQPKKVSGSKVIKHPLGVIKQVYNLPQLRSDFEALHNDVLKISHNTDLTKNHFTKAIERIEENQAAFDRKLQNLDDKLADILHQVTLANEQKRAKNQKPEDQPASPANSDLMADDHSLDNFYVHFERWFRGTQEEITKNQAVYLPYFTESKLNSKKLPVVDLGCGNGEFVKLLHDNDIRAIGVDLNETMISNVKSNGLEGVQGDAMSFLRKQKSKSFMAVTGFHIVEHIPFLDLVRIFDECYRVLAPGGFVIFETPNPENVIVGSCNFFNDPSHLHPLPPAFLDLVMKTRGFTKTEIKRLHPIKEQIQSQDPLVQEMAERFFGPQDYAIIAHK